MKKPYDPEELRKKAGDQYANIFLRAMRDRERIQEQYRKLTKRRDKMRLKEVHDFRLAVWNQLSRHAKGDWFGVSLGFSVSKKHSGMDTLEIVVWRWNGYEVRKQHYSFPEEAWKTGIDGMIKMAIREFEKLNP